MSNERKTNPSQRGGHCLVLRCLFHLQLADGRAFCPVGAYFTELGFAVLRHGSPSAVIDGEMM